MSKPSGASPSASFSSPSHASPLSLILDRREQPGYEHEPHLPILSIPASIEEGGARAATVKHALGLGFNLLTSGSPLVAAELQ
jgi:hypothetical protein